MRLVKSCEWLPQSVQDYKPIPFTFTFVINRTFSIFARYRENEPRPQPAD